MAERELLEDMERDIQVDRYVVTYNGVFDYNGLLKTIREWCKKNDYYYEEESSKEKVTPEGRNIGKGVIIHRKFTKVYWSLIEIDLSISDMKDVEPEIDGKKRNLNKGEVEAVFHTYIASSTKARWETQPFPYFIRGVVDKFIYKIDKPAYRGIVVNDSFGLINAIKGYLDIYRHIAGGEPAKGRLRGGGI